MWAPWKCWTSGCNRKSDTGPLRNFLSQSLWYIKQNLLIKLLLFHKCFVCNVNNVKYLILLMSHIESPDCGRYRNYWLYYIHGACSTPYIAQHEQHAGHGTSVTVVTLAALVGLLNNILEKWLNDQKKVSTTEIVDVMNKIKSLHSVLYSPTILELYYNFIYVLNKFKKLNRQWVITAIFHSLSFTNLIKVASWDEGF